MHNFDNLIKQEPTFINEDWVKWWLLKDKTKAMQRRLKSFWLSLWYTIRKEEPTLVLLDWKNILHTSSSLESIGAFADFHFKFKK